MKNPFYAVVDYGTNSARLMIAERTASGIKTLKKTLDTIRLGDGMQDGCLTDAAMAHAVATTKQFLEQASAYDTQAFHCFATSAVRDAANNATFKALLDAECGVDLDIISGEQEARIGYIGASRGSKEAIGIIDIGGGSTEIVTGENGCVSYAHSFRTGTVRLLQQFGGASPENHTLYDAAHTHILDIFSSLPEALNRYHWLAIGGTATALAAVDLSLEVYEPDKIDRYILTYDRVSEICARFQAQTVEQRKKTTGLEDKRADVIVFGAELLKTLMQRIGITEIAVSEADNQEGYLIEKLGL